MINDRFMEHRGEQEDVRYSLRPSPVGAIYILGTDASLKALVFKSTGAADCNIEKLFKKGETAEIRSAALFLDDYFYAKTETLSSAPKQESKKNSIIRLLYNGHAFHIDLSGYTQKEIRVYRELLKIPPGRTISYNKLSEKAGIPSGARFVGNAMAKNAFPIIIPCHRVIKSGGAIGNYSGGVGIKDLLLKHESR
ncbi:MAG: hypothetical protein A2W19_06120 [Spirochaetes bacterium RBG_16_49_21]|nr:MAG: hypothetical protein A2W19_06120 [Spirochaetes bacterium RBG_16_49_21]